MSNKYGKKSVVSKIILGVSITLFIMVLIIFLTTDIKAVIKAFKDIDVNNLLISIAFMLLYFILSPITTLVLTKANKCDIRSSNVLLIGNTEHFFNGITPFSTGGQPFQVYSYARLGVKAAQSTGILMMNFVLHMFVTNMFALLSIAIYPQLIQAVGNLLPMVIIGFIMNFVSFVIVIVLACSKRVAGALVKFLTWLAHFKWLNKLITPAIPAFNKYCDDVQLAFRQLWQHKASALVCLIIRAITMFVFYMITFYILRAFNVEIGYESLFFVVCGTSFAITTCVFIPTPGSSGGIEFAFSSIFMFVAAGMSDEIAMSGMLLWRLLTYYGLMLLGFVCYLILEHITARREQFYTVDGKEPPPYTNDKEPHNG